MPMTTVERRKKDRARKARLRAVWRDAGVPPSEAVARAIVEANSFALAGVNIGKKKGDVGESNVDMREVMQTAIRILVERGGYDAEKTRAAVGKVMAPRPEHRWPGYTPSLPISSPGVPGPA